MPFIGKSPQVGAFQLIDSITTSATDTYALTVSGSAYVPESARNLIVSLNGVTQAPESAYTVSGSNIVFASALTASDVIDYILVIGDAVDIGTPSDNTVGDAQLKSSLNLSSKTLTFANDQISGDVINGGTISSFASTGIDDNATSTAITIDSSGDVGFNTASPNLHGWTKAVTLDTATNAGYELGQSGTKYGAFALQGDGRVQLTNFTANPLTFQTNNTERMRIDSSGNVGIGTSSPNALLHVSSAGNGEIEVERVSGALINIQAQAGVGVIGTDSNHGLRLKTNGSVRATITASGNVGIGTTSPADELEIEGADPAIRWDDTSAGGYARLEATNGSMVYEADQGNTVGNSTHIFKVDSDEKMRIDSSGRVGIGRTPTDVGLEVYGPGYTGFDGPASIFIYGDANYNDAGNAGSGILFGGEYTSAASLTTFALISGIKENTSNTNYAGALTFQTRSNGSLPVERMRIDSSGNVGIGTTSPTWRLHVHNTQSGYVAGYFESQSSSTTEYGLIINLDNDPNDTTRYFLVGRANNNQTTRFHVASNGNVTNTNNSYGSISDEKLKENIVDSGSQWEDIKALRVRKYSMKEDALDAPNKLGVIAQEVEAAGMQGLVIDSTDMDENNNDLGTITKTVNYSILYMKAVKALQEAMNRIETLESEVAALKGE